MIYLISYTGGTHGEFFCTLLSSDQNYCKPGFSYYSEEEHRHGYRSIIDQSEFTFDGWKYPEITDTQRTRVERFTRNRHLVMKTVHYDQDAIINLDIKKIKFYCDGDDWLLGFMLSGPKGLITSIKTHPHTVSNEWVLPFIKTYSKYPDLNNIFIENIDNVTWAELDMLALGYSTVSEYVEFKSNLHREQSLISSGNDSWIYLNPMELFNDPKSHIGKWQSIFDTGELFDIDVLTKYHEGNLRLIEKTYGIIYDNIVSGDHKKIMMDYLLPNMIYFK
jgi:hypothetical protein